MFKSVGSTRRCYALGVILALAVISTGLLFLGPTQHHGPALAGSLVTQPAAKERGQGRVEAGYAALPLAFEENQGQTDDRVKYLARGSGYTLFLTADEAVFSLRARSRQSGNGDSGERQLFSKGDARHSNRKEAVAAVRMRLMGANNAVPLEAEEPLAGKSNYFLGKDTSKWRSNVPHYARVSYREVYPGVNLNFHGAQRQPEFDFIVAPGVNPACVSFRFTGGHGMKTDDFGDLVISSSAGDLVLHKPVAYQEANGTRQTVDASFILTAKHQVGFALGNYDHSRELVIDPSVSYAYSTFLGGSLEDDGYAVAFDTNSDGTANHAYVTGETASTNFPGHSNSNAGGFDVFVAKIAADGSSLVYSTYVGGSENDSGNAIAVDSSGDAFVAGGTQSNDFPVLPTGSSSLNGAGNAVLFELGPTGTLTYSTYLGGDGIDTALGVAVDGSGNIYAAGQTSSSNFPMKSPLQSTEAGGFVAKLKPSAGGVADLAFSTYLGGSAQDYPSAIALDASANVYLTGRTTSSSFHTTSGVVQSTYGGGSADAFVSAIKTDGSAYIYSTFLGGSDTDIGNGIAVDAGANAYITGQTASASSNGSATPFPLKAALQPAFGGVYDAFVTKLNASGSALVYSTYLGGSQSDIGAHIALDGSDNAYVTGQTYSSDFPVAHATQANFGGLYDAFVSSINASGSQLAFSTYLGGSGGEDSSGNFAGIAVDGPGAYIYVAGNTSSSSGFHTTSGVFQSSYGGGTEDAFVVKYTQSVFTIAATTPGAVSAGSSATSTVTLTAYNGYNSPVSLSCAVTGSGSPLPACSVTGTNPVTPVASPGATSTVTITATGASGSLLHRGNIFYAMWLPVAGLAFAGMGICSARSRRESLLGFILLGVIVSSLILLPACGGSNSGGGGGGGGGGSTGTPAGTYTITITGTGTDSAATTQSAQVALTVN